MCQHFLEGKMKLTHEKAITHIVVSNQKAACKETCAHIRVSLHVKHFFSTMLETQVSYILPLYTGHLNPNIS